MSRSRESNARRKSGIIEVLLLSIYNLSMRFGARILFDDATCTFLAGRCYAITGPNGAGKSTLMKILTGEIEPTKGSATRPKKFGVLRQDQFAFDAFRAIDTVVMGNAPLWKALEERDILYAKPHEELTDEDGMRLGELEGIVGEEGGYTAEADAAVLLDGLGVDASLHERRMGELQGGQKMRVLLAQALFGSPQALLLDEPTNHLDLDSVEWLEYWLRSFTGALVIVSHDRYFLDRSTEDTWEVSRGGIETYHGAYSAYLTQRAERRKERLRAWEAQQEYVAKTEEFIARHLAGQRTKEAQGRRTRLERFLRDSAIERPPDHREMTLHLSAEQRTGDLVLRVADLVAGYDPAKPLVYAPELEIRRGQKVAIVGANGAGKTTLLRTLLGELPPLEGQIRHGSRVDIGYLSQAHSELDPQATVLEAVMSADSQIKEQQARTLLGSLQLSGDDVYKHLSDLSGGERSRVVLARLVLRNANVLILDEPTNHLDIPSREIIQSVLQAFDGTVLLVSHDRYLIEAVASDVWVVEGGQVHLVPGGWEKFLAWRAARRGAAAAPVPEAADRDSRRAEPRAAARKSSNRERQLRQRHEKIEQEIEALEAELASLLEQVSAAGQAANMARVDELSRTYQQRDAHLKTLWAEWERLGEQLE